MNVKEIGRDGVDWIHLIQGRALWPDVDGPSGPIKGETFVL
jgi:hypothetical protein